MPEIEIKAAEGTQSPEATRIILTEGTGIAKAVFGYKKPFLRRSAENIYSHIAVTYGKRPPFPAVIGHIAFAVIPQGQVIIS